jgi:predicted phosphodiesterase
MQVALLADIHGNLPALEAVISDIQHKKIKTILVLGDFAPRGPFPKETMQLLQSLDCLMLRGNVETYLLDYDELLARGGEDTSPRNAINRWTYQKIGQAGLDYIRTLPQQISYRADGAAPILLVHGSPDGENKGMYPAHPEETYQMFVEAGMGFYYEISRSIPEMFTSISEKNIACGHTHVPWVWRQDGLMACNPGSVGAPISGSPAAQYATLNWDGQHWQTSLHQVPYELAGLKKAFETSGLLETGAGFSQAFLLNMVVGLNVPLFYILHARAFARSRGFRDFDALPDDLWSQVEKTFDWQKYQI